MTDPRTAPFGAVHLADVDVATDVYPDYPDATDSDFHLVRRHFDIRAFGVNGITGDAGDELVEPHHERDDEANLTDGHEELFAVVSGHALFAVDGNEIDAPAGTLVFVRDPATRRGASAVEPDTTVLVVGGTVGKAFEPSPWEAWLEALPFYSAKDYEPAVEIMSRALGQHPDNPNVLYNLACCEALAGHRDDALAHLARAAELDPRVPGWAATDSDLDPIRDAL